MSTLGVAVPGPTVPEPDVVLRGHANDVQAVCFHPDESVIYTGDVRGELRAWDLLTYRPVSVVLAEAHRESGVLSMHAWAEKERLEGAAEKHYWLLSQGRGGVHCVWNVGVDGSLPESATLCFSTLAYAFCRSAILSRASPADQATLIIAPDGSGTDGIVVSADSASRLATLSAATECCSEAEAKPHGMLMSLDAKWLPADSTSAQTAASTDLARKALVAGGFEDGSLVLWVLDAVALGGGGGDAAKARGAEQSVADPLPLAASSPRATSSTCTIPTLRPVASRRLLKESAMVVQLDALLRGGLVGGPRRSLIRFAMRSREQPCLEDWPAPGSVPLDDEGESRRPSLFKAEVEGSLVGPPAGAEDEASCTRAPWSPIIRVSAATKLPLPGANAVAIRSDARVAAVASWHGAVRLFAYPSLNSRGALLLHRGQASSVVFGPLTGRIATAGGEQGSVGLWSAHAASFERANAEC